MQNKQNTKDIACTVAHKTQEKLDKSDTCKVLETKSKGQKQETLKDKSRIHDVVAGSFTYQNPQHVTVVAELLQWEGALQEHLP